MLSPVEKLNQALRDNRPEDYLSTLHRELGLRALAFRPGESVWEWEASQERVLNPFGYVAGGYLAVFADELMASAIGSVLDTGELATTAELKISFLKPVAKGLLRGQGQGVAQGPAGGLCRGSDHQRQRRLGRLGDQHLDSGGELGGATNRPPRKEGAKVNAYLAEQREKLS